VRRAKTRAWLQRYVLSQTQNMNTAQISKEKHLAPVFLKRPPLKDPITSRVRSIHKNNPNPAQSPSLTTQHLIPAGILTERKGRNRTRKAWNHVQAGGVLLRGSLKSHSPSFIAIGMLLQKGNRRIPKPPQDGLRFWIPRPPNKKS